MTELSPLMHAGSLVLEPWTHTLFGPSGSTRLAAGPFRVMRELMRRPGATVPKTLLISALWPDTDLEPDSAEAGLHKRIHAARAAMEAVGVSREVLELDFLSGYRLAVKGQRVVRVLTPEQAARVDQMLAATSVEAAA